MTIPSSHDRLVRANTRGPRGRKIAVVIAALSIAVIALIWRTRDEPSPNVPDDAPRLYASKVSHKPGALGLPQARTIVDNGVLVYSIRSMDEGDEVLVDVATGKVLAVRDGKGLVIWEPRASKRAEPIHRPDGSVRLDFATRRGTNELP